MQSPFEIWISILQIQYPIKKMMEPIILNILFNVSILFVFDHEKIEIILLNNFKIFELLFECYTVYIDYNFY